MIEGPADLKVVERHADKSRIPKHRRMIRFNLDKAAWQLQNIDALGDTLCEFEHRSSKHSTDLGHVTVDPFRIVLKQTRCLRSRAPPPLASSRPNVRPENYKPLLVSEATRIGSAPWLSSQNEMEVYGRRVTIKINEQSIIPVLPLPVVDDLLSEMGNSRVFRTTDLISGFFQCAINKDSIPLTAACTQDGLWEWTVMPQGFSSSPGWFQSIMLRVREGLERVKLYDLR